MSKPQYDIAIVGAGTAGLPAAITAARRGAKLVLVEAADTIGGTLHMSSGSFSSGGSAAQISYGICDSAARHYVDCLKLSHGTANPDLLHLWTQHAAAMTDWLRAEGVDIGETGPKLSPGHEFYDVARTFNIPGGAISAIEVFRKALEPLVENGSIDLRLSSRMTGLLSNAAGAVTGIAISTANGDDELTASKVVLTTGGYTQNDALWQELHPAVPRRVYSYPHSKGDGLLAAQELGATVDYMQNFLPTFGAVEDPKKPDEFWLYSMVQPYFRSPWEISVNQDGVRFMAEDNPSPDARERALLAQPGQSFWVIYDSRIKREAPPLFRWPEDKLAKAFASSANFQTAGSIAQLADACGLDPARLERTVNEYNAGVAVNSDLFRRKHLPARIAEAPFYAVRHFSTSVVSWGGLVVNDRLEVLRADGNPIRNLYAAGEILGMGVFGHTFLGGSTLSSSLTFGKLLGEWLAP